jgi:A/G-specific adenine glycosylase
VRSKLTSDQPLARRTGPVDQGALLAWGERTRRDLPWRRTRDPWAVLVSELMLQQTQVARVVPRYEAFLGSFPTPGACAAGSVGDVVTHWAGLGYNRRAVNLHRTATLVVAEHGGRLPDDLDRLLRLPGIGPYTARAVLAFAWERDVGVVDTNAGRVLARVTGRALTGGEVQERADAAVPAGHGWAWNQAVLDLGATVCTSRSPRCGDCPLAPRCSWRRAGNIEPDPARGSAGTSAGQSTFEGSDRQGRGRLVEALRRQDRIAPDDLAAAAGWPDDPIRTAEAVASLLTDGLAVERPDGSLTLP